MKKIDARGKTCPQPVMMTKAAVTDQVRDIQVFVDNAIAMKNVCRLLEKMGFSFSTSGNENELVIEGHRDSVAQDHEEQYSKVEKGLQDVAVFISRAIIGGDDSQLGEVLMKSFLGTLSQMEAPPRTVALMNEGIRLALKGTSSCEHLQELEEKGVQILVCGTCSNHFGLTDQVNVGVISNMFDITEALMEASKILSI
ncbi:MAG: sulfurtransferase-like selenium metabolism protein YedF [Synergistales bacterium]|nr:sulfurtransferase-like selenium metabolism protein YedF [Synergistales bacterium]